MRRVRSFTAVLLALGAALALAAPALAWRRPTPSEKRALVRAGKGIPHAGSSPVHVSQIKVSNLGPWASMTVTIYVGHHQPDTAGAIFKRVGGVWELTKHSPGTDRYWCGIGMPLKDRLNLGFTGSCS